MIWDGMIKTHEKYEEKHSGRLLLVADAVALFSET
jgi:hypothetical protein